jgi:hypothetical protein
VVELPRRAFVPLLLEGVLDRLVVGKNDEVTRFQHVTEMFHSLANGQQLSVICAVFLLSWAKFPGEEGEGLPGVVDTLLQNGTHGGSGGVRDKCKWCGWVRVR